MGPDHELNLIWDWVMAFNFQAAGPRLLALRISAPSDPRPLETMAQMYRLMGRFDEAIGAAREVAAMRPLAAFSHALLAYVFNGASRNSEAVEAADEAIRLSPGFVLEYWQAAIAANALGQFDQAIERARQGLALDPHNVSLRHQLGESLASLNRGEEAEAVIAEYLRQEPADFNGHAAAGWSYLRLSWLDRAAERFITALELQPNYPWQHEGLGIVRYRQGRFEEARQLLNEAARLDPAMVEGKCILEQMDTNRDGTTNVGRGLQ